MKIFYTVRDIEDMHAAGVVQIDIHDDVVLTDVAREKAVALGMAFNPVEPANPAKTGWAPPGIAAFQSNPAPAAGSQPLPRPFLPPVSFSPAQTHDSAAALQRVMKIKAAVAARLGTDKYNDLLDKIIPQVMAQLKK